MWNLWMVNLRLRDAARFGLVFGFVFFLTGCAATMKPEDFAGTEPRFVLEEYLNGKTTAAGIFVDRFGKVRRQFVVAIDGVWDGQTLTLDERFTYSDGETERRVWSIKKLDEHRYTGTAGDVVGTAVGASFGNALNWDYYLNLKVDGRVWKVRFNDWMFLQPGGILLNRAEVTKWGVKIGDVQISFHKPGPTQSN
jgi:hypothetical protein